MSGRAARVSGVSRSRLAVAVLAAATGSSLLVAGTRGPQAPQYRVSERGAVDLGIGVAAPSPSAWPAVPAPAGSSTPSADRSADLVASLPRSRPTALEIPAIGLRTRLGEVGVTADRHIDVPAARGGLPAYWYRLLASPGEAGTSVLVGHVDSASDGPGVFFRVGELAPGDVITVRRADGTAPRFVVRSVRRFAKRSFPTEAVYGATATPALRLVTCGGTFDRGAGSYLDNVVVFADLVS